ncbi:hypothetical protein PInf_019049 [Phytophthora infestans]|nr:hypothetical protein PInf_019049 [Phytophthora infestans]
MVTNAADDRITFETMGWSPDSSCQESSQTASSGSTEPFFCQISDATLPPDTPACVDSYGIPLDIHHSRQLGKRDNVWDVAHVLAAPYSIGNDDDAERFTHICLICAANAASQPNAAGNARETVLRRWSHTSNVKDHMVAMHESHPVGMAEVKKRTKRARRQIASVMNDVSGYISQRVTESQEPMAKRGLPYNTVVTKDFRNLIQRVTGTANVTILSSKTYASMLEASFQRKEEFEAAYRLPFLNLLHDSCTTGNNKKGIVGTSVSFINRNWDYCNLALLVTVHNGSHASSEVKTLMTSRIEPLYGISIADMAQFTMSDTTPSARKVSKLFEDSIPTDCTMHVLNLCLLYGMGMRENTEPVYVMDSATNMQKKERRVCTVGGPFPEGARLIKKVWSLNNYFNSPQRVERLTKLQFYSLPESSPIVDCDTRVASSVTLFQRTIVNYSAFRDYFRHCEKYDDPQVFDNLSEDEWELLVEMEAITGSLTDLARIEVQRSNQVESELFVLLKAAFDRLSTDKYQIYNIDAVRTPKTNENSLPRREVRLSALSTNAEVCVRRIKSQVAKRLPTLTAESVVILLLDPRTKFTVSDLVRPVKFAEAGIAGPSTDTGDVGAAAIDAVIEDAGLSTDAGDVDAAAIDTVIEDGRTILQNAHREVYCSMHANNLSGA